MPKRQQIDNIILVCLAFVDLSFGIVSLCLTQIEWQICAVVASLLSLIQIVRILILYKGERKGEIITLIIGILDIGTGVLSVVLVYMAIKAISTVLSGLKLFKASKVAIQSSKAFQLSKPVATKVVRVLFPTLSTYILKKLNRKKEQLKMEKKDTFITYLKNNPKTIIGLVGSIVSSLACGGATSYGLVLGNIEIPLWAKIIIGAVVFLSFGFITVLGTISSGWENNLKVATRELAVKLGYSNAVNVLEEAKADYDRQQEELAKQEELKKEQELAVYKSQYIAQVSTGNYSGSLDDFIAEQKAKKAEQDALIEKQHEEQQEAELKAKWVEAIRLGETDLGFEQWKKAN